MATLPQPLDALKNVLQGKGLVAHPLHVAINHMPLGLWEAAVILDFMSRRRQWHRLGEAGYYCNLFGILAAMPTALTGLAEWADIPRDHPAWKVVLAHAVANDTALFLAVYNWWTRRERRGYAVDSTNLVVDGAMISVLALSGYLGGVIAHDYGYGTHRQGSSIEKRAETLVGPTEELQDYAAERSLESWDGATAGELDAAVEAELAQPGDEREEGGAGI